VAAGGVVGTGARNAIATNVAPGGDFPWTSLAVNVGGAFLLGVALTLFVSRWPSAHHSRVAVCSGMLGAFTTFSAVGVEIATLVADKGAALAGGYALLSLFAGLAAVWLGVVAARPARAATSDPQARA
jgi:CrcB protein